MNGTETDVVSGLLGKIKRMEMLLDHAVRVADSWHDDARGGPVEGDEFMDEARAMFNSATKEPTGEGLG